MIRAVKLHSVILNRTTATTGDKLLTTPYRRSIRTYVLPHSVNVDVGVDVVISIYSRRVLLCLLAIDGLN